MFLSASLTSSIYNYFAFTHPHVARIIETVTGHEVSGKRVHTVPLTNEVDSLCRLSAGAQTFRDYVYVKPYVYSLFALCCVFYLFFIDKND